MNPLEELSEAVKQYNTDAREYARDGYQFETQRLAIERKALDILGLKPLKVRAMLAKVTVKVVLPKAAEPEAQATLAEVGTDAEAYVMPDRPPENPDDMLPPKFLRDQKDQT